MDDSGARIGNSRGLSVVSAGATRGVLSNACHCSGVQCSNLRVLVRALFSVAGAELSSLAATALALAAASSSLIGLCSLALSCGVFSPSARLCWRWGAARVVVAAWVVFTGRSVLQTRFCCWMLCNHVASFLNSV